MRVGTWAWRVAALLLTFAPMSLAQPAANAQSPAEFYKGRNIELYIGYSVGGAYDLYARVLARHLGKHIPGNPTIVPKNMEGAGSLRLANWLYNVGAKDGTVLATIGRGTGFDPLLGSKGAQFRADKFTWMGSANNEVSVCVAGKTSGITGFEDTLSKELIVGGTGQAADTDQFPRISMACSAPNSESSPAIPAATMSRSRWNGARSRDVAAGPGRACSRRTSAGSRTSRSASWCNCRSTSIPICPTFRSSWILPRPRTSSRCSS